MKKEENKFYTYILQCSDNSFYTGYTNNLENRIKLHNQKKASKYTRSRTPVKCVYSKIFNTKNDAMSFEYQIKQLTRNQKIKLINHIIDYEYVINKKKESI